MFSEFDILEKEMANDDYKFSCMIECACMEADMIDMDDSAVVTEAEGDDVASKIKEKFAAVKEKIKEIIEALKKKVSEGMKKISNFFTSKKLKAEYEELLARAKKIQSEAGATLEHNTEWQKYLEGKSIEMYDLEKRTKGIRTVGDAIIAGVKNISAKVKGGKKITVEEVTALRREAHSEFGKFGSTTEARHIRSLSEILSFLATGGVIGGVMKLAGASTAEAAVSGAFIGFLSNAAIDIVEGIRNGHDKSAKYKEAGAQYGAAAEDAEVSNTSVATQVASLGDVIVEAETMSYREAVRYLQHNLKVVDEVLAKAQSIVEQAALHQNTAEVSEDKAKKA